MQPTGCECIQFQLSLKSANRLIFTYSAFSSQIYSGDDDASSNNSGDEEGSAHSYEENVGEGQDQLSGDEEEQEEGE